jgi:ankyrin repeat protein
LLLVFSGNSSDETPLHTAAMKGNVEGLQTAMELCPNLDLEVKDMWGRTPLLKAMVYCRDGAVEFLLAQGADVSVQDVDGVTMMHLAVTYKKPRLLHRWTTTFFIFLFFI